MKSSTRSGPRRGSSSATSSAGASPGAPGSSVAPPRRPATAAVPAPQPPPPAGPAGAGGVLLAGCREREHGAALAVEVAGEHVQHIHEPTGQGAELLRAGPD